MSENYTAPEFRKSAFNCPYCGAYAKQKWSQLYYDFFTDYDDFEMRDAYKELRAKGASDTEILFSRFQCIAGMFLSLCSCCNKPSLWQREKLIYPLVCTAPLPNSDMPDDCKKRYLEARDIADKSPCAAAALLRLCLQMLMPHLGEKGKNINEDIASLVKQHKIPQEIQQALDICRVVGNNAVHPGKIAIDDNPQIVSSLFKLLNIIVEKTISQPKEINALYAELPQDAQAAIARRDKVEN